MRKCPRHWNIKVKIDKVKNIISKGDKKSGKDDDVRE